MPQNFIMPNITKPTCITKDTATSIEYICLLSELHAKQLSGILVSDLSDHLPCLSIISNCKGNPKEILQKKHSLTENRTKSIKDSLDRINWKDILSKNGVNESTKVFHSKVLNIINEFVPERTEMIPAK